MPLLLYVLIVVVILCLVLWAVHILPFPPEVPAAVKPILMVVPILIAVLIVAARASVLAGM